MRRVVIMIGSMVCYLALLTSCIQPITEANSPEADRIEESAVVAVQPVIYRETTVTLPTYAYGTYQSDAVDEQYAWPYKKFDRERFLAEPPPIEEQTYRLLILENEYLVVQILPEIGGRIWQVIHKPSGHTMFYQNQVIKPSPWGPVQQLGWLAVGGLEWNLPVIEHGYDWGTPWDYQISLGSDTIAIMLSTPQDGRLIHAEVTVSLQSGVAAFDIEPMIMNQSGETLDMDYWHSAALAPGPENQPSAALRFISPGDTMIVHSTGNPQMPLPEGEFTWPIYNDLDLSLLGNWEQYLGFFEHPTAVGPFVGIYDNEQDAGAVRIYPADVVQGNKIFSLGFNDPIPSDNFTDDGSFYVEIHGGLAPSFFQSYTMDANANVTWQERWYPLWGIGNFITANEWGALNVEIDAVDMIVSIYPTQPVVGTLYISSEGQKLAAIKIEASPASPWQESIILEDGQVAWQVQLIDGKDRVLIETEIGR